MRAYIGCSGYFYWGWKGKFYPEDIKPSKWFAYYTDFFNSVEINSTFYKFPTKASLKRWYKDSPEKFKITVKINREITHKHRLKGTGDLIRKFYEIAYDALQEKLGTILFQLPPSFKYSEENLDRILSQLNRSFKNVIEFRDESWWNKKVYNILKDNNLIFCSISSPSLPEELVTTSSTGYVRFHGKTKWYDYKYTNEELRNWANQILNSNLDEIYIYFNNDINAYAPFNAIEMKNILNN